MPQEFQTCPCCNSNPKYKKILINIINYIKNDSNSMLSEYTLDKVICDGEFDKIDEEFKKGRILDMFMSIGKSMEEVNKLQDKVLYLEGRLSAFRDILDKFAKEEL